MMKQMACVFCGQKVGTPIDVIEVKYQKVLAVCHTCYARGGRLPAAEWEVSVDSEGKRRHTSKQKFLTGKIHLKIATGILAIVFAGLPFAYLFVNPVISILILLLYYVTYVINEHLEKRKRRQ